jgi:signal transduction histidine kinase/DNA-binding response OmpR family regulator
VPRGNMTTEADSSNTPAAPPASSFWQSLAVPERTRTLVAVALAALLYPTFGLLDWLVYPQHLSTLLTIRLVVAVACVGLWPVVYATRRYGVIVSVAAFLVLLCGVGIAAMIHATEGVESVYYAGLTLVLVFTAVYFTWPLWVSLLTFGAIGVAYYGPVLFYDRPVDLRLVVSNSFFLLSTAMVSLVAIRVRNRLARQEYESRVGLSRSAEELKRANQLKDEMFQNVSHELRTPLTLILAPIESFLERPELESEDRRRFASMRRNALRLLNLINDLLDLAKLGKEGLQTDLRAMDVKAFLRRMADDVRSMGHARDVAVELTVPAAMPSYRLDARHMERILLNLLSNALKFTPAGGRIELGCTEHEKGLRIWVEDSGIGIPEHARQRVFERFQQVDGGTTRKFGGTGIGLALVAELTALMGGEIAVDSEEGHGTRFTLSFPPELRAEWGEHAPSERPEAAEAQPMGLAELGRQAAHAALAQDAVAEDIRRAGDHGPLVLVAEDDASMNEELVSLLAEHYRVVSVPNGEKALEVALEESPHVVLSDVMMPKMDGLELARALRERLAFRDTGIVLLSARSELEDRVKGRQVGVDSYLTKPFHPREVLATIEGVLRSRMRVVGSFLVHGELGSGGQSQVYLAEHVETGESAALKIISQTGVHDTDARERAAREQQTLARIEHPNVVRIVEHGEEQQRFYVAMEYLQGATVRELVQYHGRLPVPAARVLATAVAHALARVHAAGLVHRDIKADNIMVVEQGPTLAERVRLIDFGTVFDDSLVKGESGHIVGTLPYMAPELFDAARPSPTADIYALGVTMFYMCTGTFPFSAQGRAAFAEAIRFGPTPDVRDREPEVPAELAEIIVRAMARDPQQRWSTAEQLCEALQGLADEDDRAIALELPSTHDAPLSLEHTRTA